jgi:transcriptional regulator with XRE-family HTH domain
MNALRKDQLKELISIRKLAQRVGCTEQHLSLIVNGHRRASFALAKLLTQEVNSLLKEPYFNPSDFRPEDK